MSMDVSVPKTVVDSVSAGIAGATLLGWLPPIAALATILWTLVQFSESKTGLRLINWIKSWLRRAPPT